MTSFFPFSSSSSSSSTQKLPTIKDETSHLEITVTPAASAFYAGESFAVTITFRNTRTPHPAATYPATPTTVPPTATTAATAASATRQLPLTSTAESRPEDPKPHRRRQIGLNLPNISLDNERNAEAGPSRVTTPSFYTPTPSTHANPYSPGANPSRAGGWPQSPQRDGPMNFRSPGGGKELGHTRRARSLALGKGTMSPQELVWALGGQPSPAAALPPPLPRRPGTIPAHHPHSRKISVITAISSPPSTDSIDISSPPLRPTLDRMSSSASDVSRTSSSSRTDSPKPKSRPKPHPGTPSYHNAYGAFLGDMLPPPTHPYIREHASGSTTILWAYTQLVAHFHPSNAYIPPDPLLPLRSLLLRQPVGSGSLSEDTASGSRWQLSFGTGTIGNSTQPSLTGSLFGLAKDLMYGGGGGSLEEERKRVWNMKDLPVLETARSLLGVDVKLQEGESREYTYTLPLPASLPPAHRGKAFRFSYDLTLSINIGTAHGQKIKTISVPIRVWANVSVRVYDVLRPVIQIKEEAAVEEGVPVTRRLSISRDTQHTLEGYAKHLLDALPGDTSSRQPPLSPSRLRRSMAGDTPSSSGFLDIPQTRTRQRSVDDELVDTGGSCGEVVEVLSRHSGKASYDIAKDGVDVAVVTLIKTTYRLGETVMGVVTFNEPRAQRRVIRFAAFLESHEMIPEPLLPPSGQIPALFRLHAEHRSAYAVSSARSSFSLDIPSDATPAFALAAGQGGHGGLEWRVRLNFLVTTPSLSRGGVKGLAHLAPTAANAGDSDNRSYTASSHDGQELQTDMVECVVPVQVLAGNTAFLVRPSIWTV